MMKGETYALGIGIVANFFFSSVMCWNSILHFWKLTFFLSSSESSGAGASHKEVTKMRKANQTLQEENNLLKLTIDILLDMVMLVSASFTSLKHMTMIEKWNNINVDSNAFTLYLCVFVSVHCTAFIIWPSDKLFWLRRDSWRK